MKFNPSFRVRATIYILATISSPIVAYMNDKNIIGDMEVNLWSALMSAIFVLAALNVKSNGDES